MSLRRYILMLLTTGLVAAGLAAPDSARSSAPPASTSAAAPTTAGAAPPRLTVAGNRFKINGKATRLVGQSLVVVVAPAGLLLDGAPMTYPPTVAEAEALYERWGSPDAFFARVRGWAEGTNVVRLQVSQFGLASSPADGDPVCDWSCRRDYLDRIEEAVQAAKAAGLVVILSMQYQRLAGGANDPRWALPTKTTRSAWRKLAPVFANDRSVAYELYNEPQGPPTTELWLDWRTEHRQLLKIVRETSGATRNVVFVDGLAYSQRWDGYRHWWLKDDRLAFAIHAYPNQFQDTREEWVARWNPVVGPGNAKLMRTHPTAITEWSADSAPGYCNTDAADGVPTPEAALSLLRWLRDSKRRVGLLGWSFDIPSRMGFTVDEELTPATLDGFTCGTRGWGPGAEFQDWAAGRLG